MLYREIGSTGVRSSILGFGGMRLPVIDGRSDHIDHAKATEMLHYAIEAGVNYVDTAWFYHAVSMGQKGCSEPFFGEALSGGWRERVNLTTKLPVGLVQERDDMDRFLHEQLERLQTDHLDFYLLHGISGGSWDRVRDLGAIEFLEGAKAEGLIRFPAFSFHGPTADFPRICDEYDGFAFGQIQYNYMDTDFQAGYAGLGHAADKGMGIVVMEPLKGGKLAQDLPPDMQAVFDEASPTRTPADWALRYVWNEPGVSLLLSGMSTLEQVIGNVAAAESGVAGSLTPDELAVYERAQVAMRSRARIDCTACGYCQPCPSGVDIPGVIAALNNAAMWEDSNPWLTGYTSLRGKAILCNQCGECETLCPQGLPIRQHTKKAVRKWG
jgi:predicted aldo/keto reductase-like oxidoreductase